MWVYSTKIIRYRHSRLNGNRGNNASGMSRFRKGLNQTGGIGRGGMKIGWSKNLKAGSVAQFLNTMTLCAIFFGMVCYIIEYCSPVYMNVYSL